MELIVDSSIAVERTLSMQVRGHVGECTPVVRCGHLYSLLFGTSQGWIEGSCGKPAMCPSDSISLAGVKQGLCGIIRYVSRALKERLDSHIPRLAESAEDG